MSLHYSRRGVALSLGVIGVVAIVGGFLHTPFFTGEPAPTRIVPEVRRIVANEGVTSVTASYRVENRTRDNLVIRGVTTGCGCSVASIERDVIPPGDDGTILIKATVLPGVERTLDMVVNVDGPGSKSIPFRLTTVGTAPIPHVAGHTPFVQFGDLGNQLGPVTLVLNTWERSESEPWIGAMRTSVAGISASGGLVEERPSEDGVVYRTYRYDLAFSKIPAPGRISGRVEFLDSNSRPIIVDAIPISGYVRSPVSAVPPILFASVDSLANTPRLQLHLVRSDSGGDFRAELIDGGDGLFVESLEGGGTGPAYSIQPEPGSGEKMGRLIFRTDVEGAERLEVPYLFRIE